MSIEGSNRSGLRQIFHYGARSSVNLSLLSYVEPDDPDRSEVELRLKRKWNDGSESLVFSQSDFVERLAGIIPPPWFNLTRFHGVFAPNHAWRGFVVPGPTKKRTCPAHDEPNDSDPPPTGKPSTGRAPAEYWIPWAELLRKTVGVDPEVCLCGARMIVDDAITGGVILSEAKDPSASRQDDVTSQRAHPRGVNQRENWIMYMMCECSCLKVLVNLVRPCWRLPATRARFLGGSDQCGVYIFGEFSCAGGVE